MKPERLEKLTTVLSQRQKGLTVVLENVWDPHNVSAILRTADSVGLLDVYLIYNTNAFPRLGKKSSGGSLKWMNLHPYREVAHCYQDLRAAGFRIMATHLGSASEDLYAMDFSRNTALVFGNEHEGVSPEALAGADGNFAIPQTGFVQSLNVSVAAAVSLYEAFRQRRSLPVCLGPEEQARFFSDWAARKKVKRRFAFKDDPAG
jgi:tRNA (guanosine-2'-O-)-methyltransferase